MSAYSDDENSENKEMETDDITDKNKTSEKSSDSDDESSDAMSVNDDELEKEAAGLELKVKTNPYDYNSYIELIAHYQKMTELDRLREARDKMSRHFPLTSELWLSWLKDEINLATSLGERGKVVELFERAVQDYISVDLWLEYAQFSIGNMERQDGITSVRNTFERALTAAGLHVAKGAVLWEAYREFENVVLGMMQSKIEDELNEKQKEDVTAQEKKLVTLFRRQLSCPLLDMEKTYQEFNEWLNEDPRRKVGVDIKNIESGFKKALLKLSKILSYEEQLLSSDNASKPAHYQAYLQHEKTNGDPARVQCLFERAVADLCLDASLWLQYVEYLDTTLKIDTIVIPVCKRSVRNCPWSSALWQYYMKVLERYEKPFDEVKEVMEQALQVGFSTSEDYLNLWMYYLEYMRRRVDWNAANYSDPLAELRATFNRACEHLAENFGLKGDPNCDILQFWARIEAAYCRNLEKFRLLWNDILSQGHEKTASMWLEYISLERAYGDDKHLKRLYPRALTTVQDWPEMIGNAWLNHERDEGSLSSYEYCMEKYKSRLKQINEVRERLAVKEKELTTENQHRENQHRESKKQNPKDAWKKKHEAEGKWAGVAPKSVIAKPGSKGEKQSSGSPKKETNMPPPPGYEKRKKSEADSDEPSTKKPKQEESESEHGVTVVHDSSKDIRTVFVSNLDYSVTEDKLKDIFSSLGTLTDLRLVKDFKGRSKGYCYVEFKTQAEAEAALKKDREPVEGRPMFVSKCDTDKHTRQSGFRYSTSLEKNKLFVKGLPLSVTKEELEAMFKPYGSLKDVRLVTYRNGHSKGLAYVDFHDEAEAAHALIKTDGMTVGDKTISVAISKPPDRKQTSRGASLIPTNVVSLGGGAKDLGPRGRGRTQMSFLPRSLQVSSSTTAKPSSATAPSSTVSSNSSSSASATNGESGDHGGAGDAQKPMSNADFRQMLLGSK